MAPPTRPSPDPDEAPRPRPGLAVVLPAHNEEAVIGVTVASCLETLSSLLSDFEVIVVDDGSTDHTGAIVEGMALANPSVRVVRNVPQRGYGGALLAGFASATKDRVFFMDSDGQFDIRDIVGLLPFADEGYRVVLGYRAHRKDPLVRIVNARAWNALVRLVFHLRVRDVDCAFKLFDRAVLESIDIQSEGAMINTEILVKLNKLGVNFVEAPVRHFPREHGSSTGANIGVILRAFRDLFWLRGTLRAWAKVAPLQSEAMTTDTTIPV